MKYGIVGNNDGPLELLKSVKNENGLLPCFIGLQKPIDKELKVEYYNDLEGIPFFTDFDEKELEKKLTNYPIETLINCFCNFRFTSLLANYDCINIHPSYLPYYRGRHPMHRALLNGEKQHGITIHRMNAKFDDGAILWQKKININEEMSVQDVRKICMQTLTASFPHFLNKYKNGLIEELTNEAKKHSYVEPMRPEDSELTEWNDPDLIYRKVKALRKSNFPAFMKLKDDKTVLLHDVKRIVPKQIKINSKSTFNIDLKKNNIMEIQFKDGQVFKLDYSQYIEHN